MLDFDSIKLPSFIKDSFKEYESFDYKDIINYKDYIESIKNLKNDYIFKMDNFSYKVLINFHISSFIIQRFVNMMDEVGDFYSLSVLNKFDNNERFAILLYKMLIHFKSIKDSILKDMMESIEILNKISYDKRLEDGMMIDAIKLVNDYSNIKGKSPFVKALKQYDKRLEKTRKDYSISMVDPFKVIDSIDSGLIKDEREMMESLMAIPEFEESKNMLFKINGFNFKDEYLTFSDHIFAIIKNLKTQISTLYDIRDNHELEIYPKKIVYAFMDYIFYIDKNESIKRYDLSTGENVSLLDLGYETANDAFYLNKKIVITSIKDDIKRVTVYDILMKTYKSIVIQVDTSVNVKNGMIVLSCGSKKEVLDVFNITYTREIGMNDIPLGIKSRRLFYIKNNELNKSGLYQYDFLEGKDTKIQENVSQENIILSDYSIYYSKPGEGEIYRLFLVDNKLLKLKKNDIYEFIRLELLDIKDGELFFNGLMEFNNTTDKLLKLENELMHKKNDLEQEEYLSSELIVLRKILEYEKRNDIYTSYNKILNQNEGVLRYINIVDLNVEEFKIDPDLYPIFKIYNKVYLIKRKRVSYSQDEKRMYDSCYIYEYDMDTHKLTEVFDSYESIKEDIENYLYSTQNDNENETVEVVKENKEKKKNKKTKLINSLLTLSSIISFLLFSSIIYIIITEYLI